MELIEEFTYQAMLKPPVDYGTGRMFFEVIDGRVEGARLNGKVSGGGGDWLQIGADGFGRIDVRAAFETDDGAHIYLQYHGLLELSEPVQQVLAGTRHSTDYGDQYFRTTPRLETGDERYAWVNTSVFVAEGRVIEGFGVEYTVFRVA